MNMGTHEVLLSLMIIILCSAPAQSNNEIHHPQNTVELNALINEADNNENLCVIYQVNSDDTHDGIFKDLAIEFISTVFIKIDVTTFVNSGKPLVVENQPKIIFHKSGFARLRLISKEKDVIKTKIQVWEKIQVHSDGIYRPNDIDSLSIILDEADLNGKLYLIHEVSVPDHDQMFINLAQSFSSTVFIKINVLRYVNSKGVHITSVSSQSHIPEIYFYKFGKARELLTNNNLDVITTKLQELQNMEKEQFEQLPEIPPNRAVDESDIQEHLSKTPSKDIIYHPWDILDLSVIVAEADLNEKLCLIYEVLNDDYDYIFRDLAFKNSSTVFIKIDNMIYLNSMGENIIAYRYPEMYFYKFGHARRPLMTDNVSYIKMIFGEIKNMMKDDFEKIRILPEGHAANHSEIQIYLPQVHPTNSVHSPLNPFELKCLLIRADRRQNLCVIYQVNDTDKYDDMFKNLAIQFSLTVFIKVNVKLFGITDDKLVKYNQPKIIFHTFGCARKSFSSTKEDEIKRNIQVWEKIQVTSFNDICEPQNVGDLSVILEEADLTRSLYFIYEVVNDRFDSFFRSLIRLNLIYVGIKIDITRYINARGKAIQQLKSESNPVFYFYKFGSARQLSIYNGERLMSVDAKIEEVTKNENFENFTVIESNHAVDNSDIQEHLSKAPSKDVIYYPRDIYDLSVIVAEAEISEKLCLIYEVQNDSYAQLFKNLAEKFTSIVFIEIKLTIYRNSRGEFLIPETSGWIPNIYFYKFERARAIFYSINQLEISSKLQEMNNMKKDEFEEKLLIPQGHAADFFEMRCHLR